MREEGKEEGDKDEERKKGKKRWSSIKQQQHDGNFCECSWYRDVKYRTEVVKPECNVIEQDACNQKRYC